MASAAAPESVRAFNRFFTEVSGVLQEGILRTDFTLTEARVLFELGREDGLTATTLRERLKLDAGYLSRVLGRLDAISLLTREQSASDGRSQSVHLTRAGKTAYATLDQRGTEEAAKLLDELDERDQRRLLGSMAAIRDLLGDPSVKDPFVLRPLGPGDGGWVVQRHGELYAREYGWDETFEALVARIVADHLEARNPRRERGWIAEVDGRRAGCLLCVEDDAATAKLRLLLVEPDARGLGIGGRLVAESLDFARGAGYERVTLWTNDVLTSARPIYEHAGFELVDEEPHESFGRRLVGQHWARALGP